VQLVECLKTLISQNEDKRKPTLVLNGDVLELALATDNIAAMAFERFIELILPQNGDALVAKEILFLPGNHDHHLWESARETQYLKFISGKVPGTFLDIPWHTTKMFNPAPPIVGSFLTEIIRRYPHLQDVSAVTVYPNLGLLSLDEHRCVIFSHGHLTESIYRLMSTLRTMVFPVRTAPSAPWDFEAENFAWIDFLWSALGRSGDVGKDMELVYDTLQSKKQLQRLISNLAAGIVKDYGKPCWPRWIQSRILGFVLRMTLGRLGGMERSDSSGPLSQEGEAGLQEYLEKLLRGQMLIEHDQTIPPEVTFVFGHTHKPFQKDMHFYGYPDWTSVYNSGGWVVDTVNRLPVHGGAVILIDENLNVASLRMYNEVLRDCGYPVHVEAASHDGVPATVFCQRLQSLIDPLKEPWKTFSETVACSVPVYAQNLRAKIEKAG
jgi:hypothetical protein